MTCCLPYLKSINGEARTAISYGSSMRAMYGKAPNIQLFIFDQLSGDFVRQNFLSARIENDILKIEHGTFAVGYVKIS